MATFMVALNDTDAENKKALVLTKLHERFSEHKFEIVPDPPLEDESTIDPVEQHPHPMAPDKAAVIMIVPDEVVAEVRKAFRTFLNT